MSPTDPFSLDPVTTTDTHTEPDALLTRMVDDLVREGFIRSEAVEATMRKVARDRFLPGVELAEAYADEIVITKRAADGTAISSASQPRIVAFMLEELDVRPGHRVLEIGTGTGYNPALLRELVGVDGSVTTIDIEADVVTQATNNLAAAGYNDLRILARDGALGDPATAPFDRIIVATGAWDIPKAWWDQLRDGARLVIPLRWRGQTRSITFDRHGDTMTASNIELCGFIPMQGQEGEHTIPLDAGGTVTLGYDDDQDIDPINLAGVLDEARSEAWSEVTVAPAESFDGVWLRMASTDPAACLLTVDPAAKALGLIATRTPPRTQALAEAHSIAYFTHHPAATGERRTELGAIGHGPRGEELAQRLTEHIRAWSQQRDTKPHLTAHRAGMTEPGRAGNVIAKEHIALAVEYPT